MNSSRYEENRFLKLLEAYVLCAIGELQTTDAEVLTEMTPRLQSLYGLKGDWPQIISAMMDLPPNMPSVIKDLWKRDKRIANKSGVALEPHHFAQTFVDKYLRSRGVHGFYVVSWLQSLQRVQ